MLEKDRKAQARKRQLEFRSRHKMLRAYVTNDEYDLVKGRAVEAGVNVSDWIKSAVLNKKINQRKYPLELTKCNKELNLIGNNLNQIAKRINADKGMKDEPNVIEKLTDLQRTLVEIRHQLFEKV